MIPEGSTDDRNMALVTEVEAESSVPEKILAILHRNGKSNGRRLGNYIKVIIGILAERGSIK